MNGSSVKIAAVMAALLATPTSLAHAGGIFEIIHPEVEEGKAEVEVLSTIILSNVATGEERSVHEIAFGFGVTDYWKPVVGFEIANARGESPFIEAIEIGNVFILYGGHDHDHDDHDHDKKKTAEAGHEGHAHGKFNPHIWLDPVNAKALVHEIEEVLVEADPENAGKYKANAEKVMARLDELVVEVSADLKPVHDRGFIVFHDAYQYFEKRFDVAAAGSITVSPEVMPGAERITEIRAKVQELGAACVFAEPQFEPKLVSTVTEGTQAKSGVLDPLGAGLDTGPEMYFQLIRNMAASIKTCLSKAS